MEEYKYSTRSLRNCQMFAKDEYISLRNYSYDAILLYLVVCSFWNIE
jgi:hypothetical protein